MTTELLLLSFITLAAALLFVECATEVSDAVRFFLYKGNSTASVVGKEPFSVSRSKGLVEQNENQKDISRFPGRRIRVRITLIFFRPLTGCTERKRLFRPWSGERKEIPGGRIILTPGNGLPAHRSRYITMPRSPGNTRLRIVLSDIVSC